MAGRPKSKGKITVTLELEPPYTDFAILTFGGGAKGGVAMTSKLLHLHNKEVIYVGEGGGIMQLTKPQAKHMQIVDAGKTKDDGGE